MAQGTQLDVEYTSYDAEDDILGPADVLDSSSEEEDEARGDYTYLGLQTALNRAYVGTSDVLSLADIEQCLKTVFLIHFYNCSPTTFFDEENHPMARELDYPVWKRFLHGLSYSPNKEQFGEMWGEAMLYDSSITFAASADDDQLQLRSILNATEGLTRKHNPRKRYGPQQDVWCSFATGAVISAHVISSLQSKAVTRCSLDEEMRNTVLSSTGWLDDTIINRVQSILREQFGAAGFQNTTLGTLLLFDVIRSEFIQILHNGKNHWLTISTIGLPASTVNVYDSLYQSLSQCTIDQICAVMFSTNDVRCRAADQQF
ncbi:hypothetical protein EMCRGX_G013776 [Ephydatia muelleri]